MKRIFVTLMVICIATMVCDAQTERKQVRKGNKEFRADHFEEAEVNYKKALLADSTSTAAAYNLGNTYFKLGNYNEADRFYNSVSDSLSRSQYSADLFHNMGNSLLAQKNYQGAIEAYKNALRKNPTDIETKSNLAYAQKMLENQQNDNQGGSGDQDQDQNQDQNDDQNQNQDQDQNQNNDQDKNQDQGQDPNQDQNDDQNQNQGQNPPPTITPEAAEQMLQAIQAQEKDTQDKVNKEKALLLKSKQKEKNW